MRERVVLSYLYGISLWDVYHGVWSSQGFQPYWSIDCSVGANSKFLLSRNSPMVWKSGSAAGKKTRSGPFIPAPKSQKYLNLRE